MSASLPAGVVGFDYEALDRDHADRARAHAERIRGRDRDIAEGKIAFLRNGEDLTLAKASVGHGRFDAWCAAELGYSKATALRMMRAYEVFGGILNYVNLTFSPRPSLLYALSAPSCPVEAKALIPRIIEGDREAYDEAPRVLAEARRRAKRKKPLDEEAATSEGRDGVERARTADRITADHADLLDLLAKRLGADLREFLDRDELLGLNGLLQEDARRALRELADERAEPAQDLPLPWDRSRADEDDDEADETLTRDAMIAATALKH